MQNEYMQDLADEQAFALLLDGLKDVERQNPLRKGVRRERVAEHSWHVALSVLLLHEASPEEIDVCRAVQIALVHDLAELYVGDSFAFGDDTTKHNTDEHRAMDELRASTTSAATKALIALWDEYEAQDTPEARFVKAMDVYLPIALNHANIDQSSWKNHEVAAHKVERRVDAIRGALGVLAKQCDACIGDAKNRGYLT